MPSPFPGMDVYLEARGHWESFHPVLIVSCARALNRDLPASYVARIETRISLMGYDDGEDVPKRRPDVLIASRGDGGILSSGPTPAVSSQVALLEPTTIPLAKRQVEVRERWIEILKLPELSLVTVIEILSPGNKAGGGRADYLLKRNHLIDQDTVHLVEIDLLLSGSRMPMARRLPPGDYYAIVARAEQRPDAEVYSWPLRHPLPAIPIPLLAPDGDVPLRLDEVVKMAFEDGGFARVIRHGTPLPPTFPISPADREWAEGHPREDSRREHDRRGADPGAGQPGSETLW